LVTFKKKYLAAVTNIRIRDPAEAPIRDWSLGQGIKMR